MPVWDDKPAEACGVVGVYDPNGNAAKLAHLAIRALNHRGQDGWGVSYAAEGIKTRHELGLIPEFTEISQNSSTLSSAHTRYQTVPAEDSYGALQPLDEEEFTFAHNGQFNREVLAELAEEELFRAQGTDSQVAAKLLAQKIEKHGHIEPAMFDLLPKMEGAFSLGILTNNAVYGVRDRHGMRPLVVGQRDDEAIILSSEKGGLDAVNAEFIREIEPASYVAINENGIRTESWGRPDKAVCLFEKTYLSKPENIIEGQPVSEYRYLLGQELAGIKPVAADIVVPVLGSAKHYARGYADSSGIKYEDKALAKNPNRKSVDSDRTFIGLNQEDREQAVREKFVIDPELARGQDMVLIDDSLVRGTTMKTIIQMLREGGANSVHVRIGSDRYVDTCRYGVNVQSQEELLATGRTTEEMSEAIGADSLAFTSLSKMREIALSSGKPGENYCDGCMGGKYPSERRAVILAAA